MRTTQFIIFFSIVILLYSAINYYIFSRGMQAIPLDSAFRKWYPWIFVFLASSYIIARFLERAWISPVSDVFTWIGSFWLAIMAYFLIVVLVIDIVRLFHLVLPIYPEFLVRDRAITKFGIFKFSVLLVGVTVLAGYINAISPRVRTLDLNIHKKAGNLKSLHIVMASDIHMGTLIGPRRTMHMVNMINVLKPDIVLFAGDIVDEDLTPVIRHDLGKSLKLVKAPLGVYAITGNHEYIGGAENAVKYLQDHGITMLRDTSILINNSFYIAGRDDRDKPRFSGKERKSLSEVLQAVDMKFPVILMDHQPFLLNDVAAAGVDLQLSGHTHHGQLWPLNYITEAVYELSWGYLKKGESQFYVSCGYGGWGPPVRTGNRPEVVSINITFD